MLRIDYFHTGKRAARGVHASWRAHSLVGRIMRDQTGFGKCRLEMRDKARTGFSIRAGMPRFLMSGRRPEAKARRQVFESCYDFRPPAAPIGVTAQERDAGRVFARYGCRD